MVCEDSGIAGHLQNCVWRIEDLEGTNQMIVIFYSWSVFVIYFLLICWYW